MPTLESKANATRIEQGLAGNSSPFLRLGGLLCSKRRERRWRRRRICREISRETATIHDVLRGMSGCCHSSPLGASDGAGEHTHTRKTLSMPHDGARISYTFVRGVGSADDYDRGKGFRDGSAEGRDKSIFFIRLRRVLGFIPNRVAAPSGP